MRVAVTGSTGFLGTHCVLALLRHPNNQVASVHACVRSIDSAKTEFLRRLQKEGLLEADRRLKLFEECDLNKPSSFVESFKNCDGVIHTAAVALAHAKVQDPMKEIVEPTVNGMRNVLQDIDTVCSSQEGSTTIKRVVVTSSQVTSWDFSKKISGNDDGEGLVFDETCYNQDAKPETGAFYDHAKMISETEALEWGQKNLLLLLNNNNNKSKKKPDVCALLPTAIIGRCFTKAHSKASPVWIRNILQCNPQLNFRCGWVDVEDCAVAHVRALTEPRASQKRIIISSEDYLLSQLAPIIRERFPPFKAEFVEPSEERLREFKSRGKYAEKLTLPKFTKFKHDNALSKEILKLEYRSVADSLEVTVNSLVGNQYCMPVLR